MPNQYTKFQAAAAEDPASRAFTWREWTGKKQRRGPSVKKRAVAQVFHDVERRASSSDESIISASTGTSTAESTLPSTPSSPLLLYLPSGGFRIDPFRSYPVAPNHEQMAVLDHCMYCRFLTFFVTIYLTRFSLIHPRTIRQAERGHPSTPRSTRRPSHQPPSALCHARRLPF